MFIPFSYLGKSSLPLDTQFFNAIENSGGSLTTTEKSAVSTLLSDIESAGLTSKLQAVYPLVGGTATSMKYNLMNPADTDDAFRLSFNGTITHNGDGWQSDGSTGYANTHFQGADSGGSDDFHLGFYVVDANSTLGTDMGVSVGPGSGRYLSAYYDYGGGKAVFEWLAPFIDAWGDNTDRVGNYIANRNSNLSDLWKNGTKIITHFDTSFSYSDTRDLYWSAFNNTNTGTPESFVDRVYGFGTIGYGLSDTEIADYDSAISTFLTTLSR